MAVIFTLSPRPRGRPDLPLLARLPVGKNPGGRGGAAPVFLLLGGQAGGPAHRLPPFLGQRDRHGSGGGGGPG
ncbi:hypothetical protein CA291_22665, partial [Salmonella enterica subsp. enterica serovar Enteritidis]